MNYTTKENGFICATEALSEYNKAHKSNRVISEFLSNRSTNNLILLLKEKYNIKPYTTQKGVKDGTYMHPDMFQYFYNWLYKIPNKSFSRDEFEFFLAIETTFNGILTFERQKYFGIYCVDIYCNTLNLCIEYDEKEHKFKSIEDEKRQKEIETNFGVTFYRHPEKENVFSAINNIMKIYENKRIS